MKRFGWTACGALAVWGVMGCGVDSTSIPVDAGDGDERVSERFCESLGQGCDGDGACANGTTCTTGQAFGIQAVDITQATAGDPAAATRRFDVPVFPEGMCSSQCVVGNDECGGCAVCASVASVGRRPVRTDLFDDPQLGVCRPLCIPTRDGRGGCAKGYACDVGGICLNACRRDRECKISLVDSNGDGQLEPVFDPESPSVCDPETGHCGAPGVEVGAACELDSDCGAFQSCLGTPGEPGICVQELCEGDDALPCAEGAVCDVRNFDGSGGEASVCLPGCTVAAEVEADQLGEGGHGAGCAAGHSCVWDGQSDADASPNGGCLPGEYNDVQEPNVGEPCIEDSECYSPFGLGECRFEGVRGVATGACVVRDCIADRPRAVLPGVETSLTICPAERGACLPVNESGDRTVCLRACETSADCPSTYGCVDVAGTGDRACHWLCETDADCRAGARCMTSTGAPCAASGSLCICSADIPTPEPDAGRPDGGTPDSGVPDGGTSQLDAAADAATDAGFDAAADAG